jgi:hypothetical protein
VEHDLFGKPASTFFRIMLQEATFTNALCASARRSVDDIAHAANLMVAAKAAACR